jgi:hypothetical protein
MSNFQDAYAKYKGFKNFSYNCIMHLIENSELVWKILKYNDPEAWDKPNLSREEKRNLIYKGDGEISNYRVFSDVGQNDVWDIEACLIRISPYSIFPDNRSIGTLYMSFEVFSHYKINHLSDYTTRTDTIMEEFLRVFNGANIGGIGLLNFNRIENVQARAEMAGQIPYKGRWLLMGVKSN